MRVLLQTLPLGVCAHLRTYCTYTGRLFGRCFRKLVFTFSGLGSETKKKKG